MEKEKILKAGEIAAEIKEWILPQIKKGVLLLEIAELIEEKICELGGQPAFPVNLSINEDAAHYTPSFNDDTVAEGLLKVDFGVEIDGWISDTAFSVDLENSELNRTLIKASEEALTEAEKILSAKTKMNDVGKVIQERINFYGFNPVVNLSGHSMEQYDLHSGISVPNVDNNSGLEFGEGLFALEPFATNGRGFITEGKKGNIYLLENDRNVRHPTARKILNFIRENYGSLPFASRWLIAEFGNSAILALNLLEREGVLHHYPVFTEEKGKIVSQAENTFLIEKNKVTKTTA